MDPGLYRAAMEGDIEKLKGSTDKFAVQFTKNNNTVLHIVAEFGHSPCVADILKKCRLLLRCENAHGDTPLHIAAAGGHDNVVESLINFVKEASKPAAANDGRGGGAVSGVVAPSGGQAPAGSEITPANEQSIPAAANVGGGGGVVAPSGGQAAPVGSQITPANEQSTPAAANVGGGGVSDAPTVREMLKARNRDGDTPLHLAARLENPLPVVRKLTEADQELDYTPNKAGETPLYMVVARGSDVAVVSQILEKCKSPAYRGPSGRTAMHAAVIDITKDEILNKLLDWAPNGQNLLKQRDSKGWTPLHFAAHNGNLEAVKKLLDKDKSVAYVMANNDEGNTALHIATATGNVLIMNEILQKRPDCWEMANSKGRTILHIAVDMERDVAVNFILKKPWVRRLMNRKDNEGNTPFHLLASKGKVGLHMYPGADMLALNNETMTPLDILNREVSKHKPLTEEEVRALVAEIAQQPKLVEAQTLALTQQLNQKLEKVEKML